MSHDLSDQSLKKTDDTLAKIAINKDADRALTEFLSRLNDGFDAGRATKQDVASHVILEFVRNSTDADIHGIRAKFFNPILLMEATLKRAKETGVLPDSMRELLFEQFTAGSAARFETKKTRKALKADYTKDIVDPDKEAA